MKTCLILLLLFISSAASAQRSIVFIVNASNPSSQLTTFQISDMFLKKSRTWADGAAVRFFDRADNSEIRKSFLKTILRRTAREIDQYWIGQKLYTGNSAPAQIASDSMTIAMVSRFPGAIGYIDAENFQEAAGIKKVEIINKP